MSRHKMPPLNARNWDALADMDAAAADSLGKSKHAAREDDRYFERGKAQKQRQNFHRSRMS